MSDEPHDPLPRMLADVDQALAISGELARLYRGLYDAFRKQGFTEGQSITLAVEQMRASPS